MFESFQKCLISFSIVFQESIEEKIREESDGAFAEVLLSIISREPKGQKQNKKNKNKTKTNEEDDPRSDANVCVFFVVMSIIFLCA